MIELFGKVRPFFPLNILKFCKGRIERSETAFFTESKSLVTGRVAGSNEGAQDYREKEKEMKAQKWKRNEKRKS